MRRWMRIFGLLLAFLLYAGALDARETMEEETDIAAVMLDGEALDTAQAKKLQAEEAAREDPLEINFWGEAGETSVESRESGRRTDILLVFTGEQTELLLPGSAALTWDKQGCFLDRESARELFGEEQAAGQTVWCGGRAYTVYGTFPSLLKMIICRAGEGDGQVLSAVSCRSPAGGEPAREAEAFLMRYGLSGSCLDLTFLGDLCRDLLLLFPVCLALQVMRLMLRLGRGEGDTLRPAAVLLLVLTAAGTLLFVGKQFAVPADMIPTTWSDFSFWGTWWEGQKRNLLNLFRTVQGEGQLLALWAFLRSAAGSVGAALCALVFLFR